MSPVHAVQQIICSYILHAPLSNST